jgi:phage FluMu protein Com
MITFPCSSCGAQLEADTASSGLSLTCPQCRTVQTVPLPDFLPRSACTHCQADLMLTADQAGCIVKCPKCGGANRAPDLPGAQGSGCAGWTLALALFVTTLFVPPVFRAR